MPRRGHRRKHHRYEVLHRQRISDERLEKVRQEIQRLQAERRREDDDWFADEHDVDEQ